MIRNFAICVFVFLSLTVIVGCKKKAADASEPIQSAESVSETVFSPETEAESTVQPAEEANASQQPPLQDEALPNTAPTEEKRQTQTAARQPSTANSSADAPPQDRIDDMFIYKITQKRIVPEDFLIGPLENLQSSDYRTSLILKTANTFFKDLRIGTLNEECIHPSALLLLSSSFDFYLEEEAIPDFVRIGKAEITGKSARINLRFYRDKGVTDGEMILEETETDDGKKWLITDFQADLMKLFDEYKPPEDPFEPGAYNFYNWE